MTRRPSFTAGLRKGVSAVRTPRPESTVLPTGSTAAPTRVSAPPAPDRYRARRLWVASRHRI